MRKPEHAVIAWRDGHKVWRSVHPDRHSADMEFDACVEEARKGRYDEVCQYNERNVLIRSVPG